MAEKRKHKTNKEKLKIPRHGMPKQDAGERARNFSEVALGYSDEMAMLEAERCIHCKNSPCVAGCPVEVDIPGFIERMVEGEFLEAIRLIKGKNSLPAICGRVCPQEDQCEKVCTLGIKGKPVAIGRLERFAADYELGTGEVAIPSLPPPTGMKVAVVGSGPSGLTVASDLVRLGHSVTVFEALHKPGGVLIYGIPEFRLPKSIVEREVNYLSKLGVEFRLNFVVGQMATVDELMEEGYDAVFLGNGAGLPRFMNIPGENLNGVYSANEFLTRVNLMKAYLFPEYDTPVKKGKSVAVVGAGNVSMDSARTALRLGAKNVNIIYRRSRVEMPARAEEIENAEEEGVQFHILTNPVRVLGDERGWVRALECVRMTLGEPDSSGRRSPVVIPGSEFEFPVDLVIMAIGNMANPLAASASPDIKLNRWGNIIVDEGTGQTSKEGVFAGGDIVTGSATVILAMGAGRVAAHAIHDYLVNKKG